MDFGQIQDEVESWLLDLPSGAASRVPGWTNQAIKDAAKRHNFKCMEAELTPDTVDQQRLLVALPADWKEHRGLPYLYRQDGSTREINWAPSESEMIRTYAIQLPDEGNTTPADEGEPRYLLERGEYPDGQIDVFPLPDDESDWDNGNWRLVVPYWAYPADLALDSATNFFTLKGDFYCIWKAVSLGFAWNRDEERAQFFEAKAEREFKTLERIDKRSKLPDRITLGAYKDVYAPSSRSGSRS
jgi:hypothetical protein